MPPPNPGWDPQLISTAGREEGFATTGKSASSALWAPFRALRNDITKRRHREPGGWLSLHRHYKPGARGSKIMKDEKLMHCKGKTDNWKTPQLLLLCGWWCCGSVTRGWMHNGDSVAKGGQGGWKEGREKAKEAQDLVTLRSVG